jgi:hypothetical protein
LPRAERDAALAATAGTERAVIDDTFPRGSRYLAAAKCRNWRFIALICAR